MRAPPRAVQCFADLVRLTSPAAQKVTIVSAKRIPFPQVAPNVIAYRVVATLAVGKSRTVRAYFDAVLLQHGQMQSALVVTSLGAPCRSGRSRSSRRSWRVAWRRPPSRQGPVA